MQQCKCCESKQRLNSYSYAAKNAVHETECHIYVSVSSHTHIVPATADTAPSVIATATAIQK
jgi:hypothetical protein